MIHSMTAFARAQTESGGLNLTWELRSVNHRFLEAHFRVPDQLRGVETDLRERLRKRLRRGKVDCALRLEQRTGEYPIELNRPLLLQLLAVLEQIRRDAPEVGAPSAIDLLRWPGIIAELGNDDESVANAVGELFEQALEQLANHRQREGEQLRVAIVQRLDEVDAIVNELKTLTAAQAGEVRARLTTRVEDLGARVDIDRMEQEVVLLAQRADVSEELDRLRIHVTEARGNLLETGPHGRRLDFLAQELNREANTLGSKSILAETSQKVVDLKVMIEQIREQVQNVE